MRFIAFFLLVAVVSIVLCIYAVGLEPPGAVGVTAFLLTIIKTGYDEIGKGERVRLKMEVSLEDSVGRVMGGTGATKTVIKIVVTVFNPCDFQIPIKSVELRFIPPQMQNRPKEISVENWQTKWTFDLQGEDKSGESVLLEKRHSVDFVLQEPIEKMRRNVYLAFPSTLWIAVYSHDKEIGRIKGEEIRRELRAYCEEHASPPLQ